MSPISPMQQATAAMRNGQDISPQRLTFYQNVLETLNRETLPYLIGGAHALSHYTGISRQTKDFDIFIARDDYHRISKVLSHAGYETQLTYPHWLGKVRSDGEVIDLVFSSGNGIAVVDNDWFTHSVAAELFGAPVRICPAEETIWSKAYIMERERFDGADIAHLILAQGQELDWSRLFRRFGPHWRLLLSHLVLFGFIYPAHRDVIPNWIMDELISHLNQELQLPAPDTNVCGGTLLSREQYLNDIDEWQYRDARVVPIGNMTEQETVIWTKAIESKKK